MLFQRTPLVMALVLAGACSVATAAQAMSSVLNPATSRAS